MALLLLGGALLLLLVIYVCWAVQPSGDGFDHSISAYITGGQVKPPVKQARKDKYRVDYADIGQQILILFGTEYGFSEQVAKRLFDRIADSLSENQTFPWQPRLANAKDFQHVDFSREQLLFLIISTSGDGIPPTEAKPFYDWLVEEGEELSHLQFAVLALGDSNYPQFCKTGRVLHARLQELGAGCLVERVDVDQEDWAAIDMWMSKVTASLAQLSITPRVDYLQLPDSEDQTYSRRKPFMASLKVKQLLTVVDLEEDKETIHCEFDISGSGLTWISGDALGIYPQNCPSDVSAIVTALTMGGDTRVASPDWAYQPKEEEVKLRETLLHYYDLKHIQTSLLVAIQKHCTDASIQNHIQRLLSDKEALQKYTWEHEVADVLTDFASVKLPLTEFLACLKPLQPRYYSISSSPLQSADTVCVTAAVVRYWSLGRERGGVTTTFLQDRLSVPQLCPVFVSSNPDFRLPADPSLPIILVGPGTGLAPFRAFLQERELANSQDCTHLYFGCRHKDKDYLYQEELEAWQAKRVCRLRTAFSRDGPNKVYVQDLLREDASLVWQLLQAGASVYVCGDARHMAHDVHVALQDIVREQGGLQPGEVTQFLTDLEVAGRYQKDVWVT